MATIFLKLNQIPLFSLFNSIVVSGCQERKFQGERKGEGNWAKSAWMASYSPSDIPQKHGEKRNWNRGEIQRKLEEVAPVPPPPPPFLCWHKGTWTCIIPSDFPPTHLELPIHPGGNPNQDPIDCLSILATATLHSPRITTQFNHWGHHVWKNVGVSTIVIPPLPFIPNHDTHLLGSLMIMNQTLPWVTQWITLNTLPLVS